MLDEIFPEGITETIVTTLSSDGIPNAAPMGIVKRGQNHHIAMYPGTRTYRNVEETGYLVANIITDPLIFVISAFEDLDPAYFKPNDNEPPVIKDAAAWVQFKANIDGVVRLTPERSVIVKKTVPRFSRGFASVIDATITGTRLKLLGDKGKQRIREDDIIVRKCGTQRDIEAMEKLKQILNLE